MYQSSSHRPSGRKPGFSGGHKSAHPHSRRSGAPSASGSRFGGPRKSFGGHSSRPGGFSRGGPRPSFSGSRGGSRGGRGGFAHKKIDVSRYVNKSVAPKEAAAPYVPKHTFNDFLIDERIKKSIEKKGYKIPTPIQDQSIPHILEGKDIVGIANTGTGKTAAFLIPLIHKVVTGTKERVLVLAPTRELAQQIDAEFKEFTRGSKMFSVCAVGGASIGMQLRDLKHYNDFVIGTPGRIRDLMKRHAIDLSKFSTVVLDEADRMLDMGFIHDVKAMLADMPPKRHTIFFSATLSSDIEKLIKDFLKDPVRVSVKTGDTSKNVEQDVIHVKTGAVKFDILKDLLKQEGYGKVLVFGRTKHGVQKLSDMLEKAGIRSVAIHGNKSQSQRMRALEDFKKHRAQVMVATDVAARGLDIADISHVINYDVPGSHEDYIHRIGRTGRGDKQGKALTFVEAH